MRLRRLYPTAEDYTISDDEKDDLSTAQKAQGTGTASGAAAGSLIGGALGLIPLATVYGAPLAAITVPAGMAIGSAIGGAIGASAGGKVADDAGKDAQGYALARNRKTNELNLRQQALSAFLKRSA